MRDIIGGVAWAPSAHIGEAMVFALTVQGPEVGYQNVVYGAGWKECVVKVGALGSSMFKKVRPGRPVAERTEGICLPSQLGG